MSNAILVAGSANLDFVVRAAHVPAPGETVLGREFATFPGGKGANQAVACARAGGATTRMLLALGEDPYAAPLEASLRGAGVELHVVRTRETATGTAFICLADDAENAITVAPGANALLRAEHLPPLAGVSHLLLQLETPIDTVTAYAVAARAAGVTVVLNAAPARELPTALLDALDVLIVNEGELATITTGLRGRIAEALTHLAVPCVIVTLGARGACARARGEFHLRAAYRVRPVDTTGAGDTFCGAFTAASCQGSDLPDALAFASAAGALATTRLGAQTGVPARDEVEKFRRAQTAIADDDALRQLAAYCGLENRSV
ncbi:MAG: ribokinase [Rudaea sp.]|uniref:ribokinase n=1 Tax=Rudaea sp. TaxID=2136325 RepID=UPI0039E3035A